MGVANRILKTHLILGGPGGLDRKKAFAYHQNDGSTASIASSGAESGDYYGGGWPGAAFW